jgi:hypothetical protein
MDRLDRSIGIYMIELYDGWFEPDPEANAEGQVLLAPVLQ